MKPFAISDVAQLEQMPREKLIHHVMVRRIVCEWAERLAEEGLITPIVANALAWFVWPDAVDRQKPWRWVYFADRRGVLKVGFSAKPLKRMIDLGSELIAVVSHCHQWHERALTDVLAPFGARIHSREWFGPGREIEAFKRAIRIVQDWS